jgi:hypothetical protein
MIKDDSISGVSLLFTTDHDSRPWPDSISLLLLIIESLEELKIRDILDKPFHYHQPQCLVV